MAPPEREEVEHCTMKGIILAGGTGERMLPLTKVTNKHLLPIYDKPMIYYPLQKLIDAGVKEILIVSGRGHAGHFLELLGSGSEFGVKLNYAIQETAGGIAQALGLAEVFADEQPVCVILGDNIFQDDLDLSGFTKGGRIFLKEVDDPERFGVATLDSRGTVSKIVEKPKVPETHLVVTGAYIYDASVFSFIKTLKPSSRNELEITDVNNYYIKRGEMDSRILKGKWADAGTFESLYRANSLIRDLRQR